MPADDVAPLHRVVHLRADECGPARRSPPTSRRRAPQAPPPAQRIDVGSDERADRAGAPAPIAERHRDRACRPDRCDRDRDRQTLSSPTVIASTSPSPTPSAPASCLESRAAFPQTSLVSGSGSSCSQALLAKRSVPQWPARDGRRFRTPLASDFGFSCLREALRLPARPSAAALPATNPSRRLSRHHASKSPVPLRLPVPADRADVR